MVRAKKIAPALDPLEAMLTRLRPTGIREQFDALLDERPANLSARETLAVLCEREIARKDYRRIEMALKLARFPVAKELASFDFDTKPPNRSAISRPAAESPMAKTCSCLARPTSARRIWPSRSAARRSGPAMRRSSSSRRIWRLRSPRRRASGDWRNAYRAWPNRNC